MFHADGQTDGQMDKHDEGNSRIYKFLRTHLKIEKSVPSPSVEPRPFCRQLRRLRCTLYDQQRQLNFFPADHGPFMYESERSMDSAVPWRYQT